MTHLFFPRSPCQKNSLPPNVGPTPWEWDFFPQVIRSSPIKNCRWIPCGERFTPPHQAIPRALRALHPRHAMIQGFCDTQGWSFYLEWRTAATNNTKSMVKRVSLGIFKGVHIKSKQLNTWAISWPLGPGEMNHDKKIPKSKGASLTWNLN